MHVVIRPFNGPGGRTFNRGEIIDASGFRLRRQLVEQKFLAPVIDAPTRPQTITVSTAAEDRKAAVRMAASERMKKLNAARRARKETSNA